jgi:hypothetical protein
MRSKHQNLYSGAYPHFLAADKRLWVIQAGTILVSKPEAEHQGRYKVTKVIKSPIPGANPVIEAELIEKQISKE